MWGVVLGGVRKGKETSLCHQIFPNLEQYLSLAFGVRVCFTLGTRIQDISVFDYFSSCGEGVTVTLIVAVARGHFLSDSILASASRALDFRSHFILEYQMTVSGDAVDHSSGGSVSWGRVSFAKGQIVTVADLAGPRGTIRMIT